MSRSPPTLRDYVAVGVSLTIATMSIAAIYFSKKDRRNIPRVRPWTDGNGERFKSSTTNRCDARGYPYLKANGGVPPSTPAVRYGTDGRRRLFGKVDAAESIGDQQAEMGGGVDPRGRALASSDVLLAVFSFLDSPDVIACGETCVALRETATDDTIWINYTKRFTARLLAEMGTQTREHSNGSTPSFLLQGGLGRVLDLLYARLPRSYVDLYPRLPPTRELPKPRRARMSWHRLWVTIAWVQREQVIHSFFGDEIKAPRQSSLTLERNSDSALAAYGATAFFPEQVLLFVSFLFWTCCADYRDELIQQRPHDGSRTVPAGEREQASAPAWGDMLSVLNGYRRLYEGRTFVNMKDNMGFLLQEPGTMEKPTSCEEEDNSGSGTLADLLMPTRKRKLRIPCTHGTLVENLESPVAQLRSWPYLRQLTLDSLMAEFATHKDNVS